MTEAHRTTVGVVVHTSNPARVKEACRNAVGLTLQCQVHLAFVTQSTADQAKAWTSTLLELGHQSEVFEGRPLPLDTWSQVEVWT